MRPNRTDAAIRVSPKPPYASAAPGLLMDGHAAMRHHQRSLSAPAITVGTLCPAITCLRDGSQDRGRQCQTLLEINLASPRSWRASASRTNLERQHGSSDRAGERARLSRIALAAMLPFLCLSVWANDSTCTECHPEQVEAYRETGMGRSLGRSSNQPDATFTHEFSGTRFTVTSSAEGMLQRVERDGWNSERPVDFVIGSGNHAFGYLIARGRHLFQSSISYYTRRGVWDVAPGYETNAHPEFERPVTAECLWCHAGRPRPIPGSLNQYSDPTFDAEAISCDRCHGPTREHLASPGADTILTPSELSPRARDSVCEQCHLSGEARILNPNRAFGDFQPGMELEEVFSVYLYDQGTTNTSVPEFKVVSHVEQLAASRCAQVSGDSLWCGTCHDPHGKADDDASGYRRRCQGCHPPDALADHPEPAQDCVGCHMPSRQAYDSGHSAFTDHRIARRPEEPGPAEDLWKLRAWREPRGELAQRNLGLAYARLAERSRSPQQASESLRYLVPAMRQFPETDLAIPHALGRIFLGRGRTELAVELFEHVVRVEPRNPIWLQSLADGLHASGNFNGAVATLERAIEFDPLIESSYRVLATTYASAGKRALAAQTWERYLELVPDSIYARQAKRAMESDEPVAAPSGRSPSER